jgi:hypothetical protein
LPSENRREKKIKYEQQDQTLFPAEDQTPAEKDFDHKQSFSTFVNYKLTIL